VLSQWAEDDPRPFVWLRLDERDNDLRTLIASVAEALGANKATRTVAGLGRHLVCRQHPVVLVLDDAHALRAGDSFEFLEAIVEAMPPGSQLALASREEPGLTVGSLRAHRRVVELRTGDLAMGRSEAAALLSAAGLRLGADDLDTLVRRTEGWPAGLYLAALSLRVQPHIRAAVSTFAGDDSIVADYMRDELLAPLSPERVAFLTNTSMLETLTGPLCDAVLDCAGSGRTLADLARSNVLLVSLDRNGQSYRYHSMFAEMLRSELRRLEPDLEPELHRRASAWYAAHGEAQSTIRHAIAAGDVRAAGELLWTRAADDIAHGGNEAVRRWLEEFTEDQIASCAPLALVAAASSLAAGDRTQVERWTAVAARSPDLASGEGGDSLRAALEVLRAAAARDGVTRMGVNAARAVQSEPDHSPWRATGKLLEGVSYHLTGRREEARVRLEEGGRGGAAAVPDVQAVCLAQLALLVVEDEEWEEAAVLTARARSQAKAFGLEDYPTFALVFAVSSLVRASRGMVDEARRDLNWSARLLTRLVDFAPWYGAETRIALARAALRLGDVTAARTLLVEATHLLRDAPDSATLGAWLEETRAQLEAVTRSAGETCALTTAELRVLRLLPTHLSLPAIATRLYVSPNTVKTHARAVYRKLDASSRGEAVAHALAAGLLDDVQAASIVSWKQPKGAVPWTRAQRVPAGSSSPA
jgi:LuxR family transcriptional regulator, maltose regulon positive regulatory protein